MKKNIYVSLLLVGVIFTGSNRQYIRAVKAEENTLRIYNWGDYIYEKDPDEPGAPDSIVNQFKSYYQTTFGESINVIYSTFDVNETAYSNIKKLGQKFDLVAPSEYMIQKMAKENMLETFDRELDGTYTHLPNYNNYASPYLKGVFDDIAINSATLADYATGYMWGTIGLLYNPSLVDESDVNSWRILYDTDYKKQATLKNSVREAYLIALIDVYFEEITALNTQYKNAEITLEVYNDTLTDILNRDDEETIALVETSLKTLKANSYGLEVDSGKNDIVNKNIGMQVTWSGDAVYSMDVVEESEVKDLLYVVPEEAGNIWFDGWVMPKGANKLLAQRFVNFVADPEMAILNMEYIGYTSFIAGDAVWDYVLDREDEDGEFALDLTYFFDGTVDGVDSFIVNTTKYKQLHASYPDQSIIDRSIVMRDFGDKTDEINQMWSRVKTQQLSVVLLAVVGGGIGIGIAVGLYFYYRKKNSLRARRRSNLKKA